MTSTKQYRNYQDILDRGKKGQEMTYRDKKKLIKHIDQLDTKDHIGILRIIMESIPKQIYTVNNYGTYFDLNDLDNQTLWKISYQVSLCLENLDREREKDMAQKKYLEDRNHLEENLRNRSKLKLTASNLKSSFSTATIKESSSNDLSIGDAGIGDSEDEDHHGKDLLAIENKVGLDDTESDLPIPDLISSQVNEDDEDDNEEDISE